MAGRVFPDSHNQIAYIRQLTCKNNQVWISNSYESNEGLNPGTGGNILLLEDFDAGELKPRYSHYLMQISPR